MTTSGLKDTSPPGEEEQQQQQQDLEDEELRPEDSLDYYVVTLTFRAQDVTEEEQIPTEEAEERTSVGMSAPGGSATAAVEPTTAAVFAPAARQQPAPWVPRRSGFPTAYG